MPRLQAVFIKSWLHEYRLICVHLKIWHILLSHKFHIILIVQFQKISILPPRKVVCFSPPPPPPPGNSSLASYFACKILAFNTPLPLGISNDLPWGRYGTAHYSFSLLTQKQPYYQLCLIRLSGGSFSYLKCTISLFFCYSNMCYELCL